MINSARYRSCNNKILLMYIIIFAVIMTPSISILNMPAFRIEQIIIVVYMLSLFIKLLLGQKIKMDLSGFTALYLGFSIIIVLSVLVGSLKGVRVKISDFYEIYKIVIYLGIYLITESVAKTHKDKMQILKIMRFCLLLSALVAVQQYFNLFNLNERYVPIIAPTQFRTLVRGYRPRVVGMMSNPNAYSLMPGIGGIISWGLYLDTKERGNILYLIVFVITVLMTSSRTGFVFISSGIIAFSLLYSNLYLSFKMMLIGRININATKRVVVSSLIIVSLGIIIFKFLPEALTWRLVRGLNIHTDNSFQARLSNWQEHFDSFRRSPIFGLGPAKSIKYLKHADNEWLMFLRQYGIVGTLYIIGTYLSPLVNQKNTIFKALYLSILAGSALYMIPAVIYNLFQVMPIIMVIMGLI